MGYYFECYLHDDAKGERRNAVKQAVESVKRHTEKIRFKCDFIAVCGASGLSVGSIIAYELGIPCVIVRKTSEAANSHCGGQMLTPALVPQNGSKYIIVDDFIAGGNTVTYVRKMLSHCTCIGFYGYAGLGDDNANRCREHNLIEVPKV